MSGVQAVDANGTAAPLNGAAVDAFAASLRGPLLRPGDAGYDGARRIWNGMIDRKPALIARCTGPADVMASVRFARQHNLRLAVRGGGHNIGGSGLCDGGLVIDLSAMRSVRVDPKAKRATVGAGAILGDVDHETQAFGLAVPLGINSTTGIAGLTLGGGFGWLSRQYGLTADSLLSADVVTADGTLIRASAKENPDLFWAIRGGGGNFGIVTSFEFKLYPVGPEVFAGLIVFPLAQARAVLQKWRNWIPKMPREMSVWCVIRKAPPLPFLPAQVHGQEVVVLALLHAGRMERGKRAAGTLRRFGKPVGEHVGPMPYTAWQQAFDPLLAPGARNYWKSHNLKELPDGAIDKILEFSGRLPSPHCEILAVALGGKINRVPVDASAYAQRDAEFLMNVHGRWESAAEDEAGISWSRELFRAVAPFASGGVYVNFMTAEEGDRVRAAYGPNFARLAEIKAKYDPTNLFRLNQNIPPARTSA
jgi:FAD/FMN-containing dehydrogenase